MEEERGGEGERRREEVKERGGAGGEGGVGCSSGSLSDAAWWSPSERRAL